MSNMQETLKAVEESVQVVEDPELRKIAFHELLVRALREDGFVPDQKSQKKGTTPPQAKKRAPEATRQAVGVTIRPEVASLDLSPDEPLAIWDGLSADWKKFCWILEAARLKNVDGLTNSEISHLIEKTFREHYHINVVNNLKVQLKKSMVKSVVINS